jgi:hypothetical protein
MDKDDIVTLASDLEKEFQAHKSEDKAALGMVLQSHVVEMQKDNTTDIKAVGTGYGALVAKQNFAFLSSLPFVRFNAPDERLANRAEEMEKINIGMWKLSRAYLAWLEAIRDVCNIGRGWVEILPIPKLWSGPEWEKGDRKDQEFRDDIMELKLRHWPIMARSLDARNTWPTFDLKGNVDQVVDIGEITARQAKKAYGANITEKNDQEKVRVIGYTDDTICATVLSDAPNSASKWAKEPWRHGMGVNPRVLLQAPPLPPNDLNLRWAGTVFDLRHLVPELDGAFSDWRHNTKRRARSQPVLRINAEARKEFNPAAKSYNDLIEFSPDDPIILGTDEGIDDYSGSKTPDDLKEFIATGVGFAHESAIRRNLLGLLEQGGDSGVRYNTGAQLAQKQFGPTIDYLIPAAEQVTERLLASVKAMFYDSQFVDEEMKKIPLHFVDHKGIAHKLEVTPKGVKGWDKRLQARIELAIPINRNAEIVTGRLAADMKDGIMDLARAMEEFGNDESPQETIRNRRMDKIRTELDAGLVEFIRERSFAIQAQPGSETVLAQRYAALPPEVQREVQAYAQQLGQNVPGPPEARGEANRAQTTLPQNPSNTVATRLSSGVGV